MNDNVETDDLQATGRRVCPSCGALIEGHRCWLCGATSTFAGASLQPKPVATAHDRGSQSFALSSLFLFITLISVCLGVLVAAPGLGILLAVLAVPALLRTSAYITREEAGGRPTEMWDKVAVFLGSLGVVIVFVVASGIAFYPICWTAFIGGGIVGGAAGAPLMWILLFAIALGIAGGAYVGYLVVRWLLTP